MDLNIRLVGSNIYRTFHPTAAEYIFFSNSHRTFSSIEHMLGHTTSLNKFKKTEVISSIFSNQNGMKIEINYKKKTGKITNTWSLNNKLLNNKWDKKKSKEKFKKYLEKNESGNTTYPNLWDAVKAILRVEFIEIKTYIKKKKDIQ